MLEIVGWTASILFSLCGLPQVVKCIKQGHAKGISKTFIWMWFTGEVLMQIYVFLKHGWDLPLLWNYWLNSILVIIIIKYIYFPKKEL